MGNRQLQKILAVFLSVWGATIGYQLAVTVLPLMSMKLLGSVFSESVMGYVRWYLQVLMVIGFATIGYLLAPTVVRLLAFTIAALDNMTEKFSWHELFSMSLGMILGLAVANLLSLPLWSIPFGGYPAIILNLILGIVGARVFQIRHQSSQLDDSKNVLGMFDASARSGNTLNANKTSAVPAHKILDTSVIVDGRILDVARTGFLEGTLVIPEFVLHELQGIADSADSSRRIRGRRGLDVVNELQNLDGITVEISQTTVKTLGSESVDSALLELGKRLHAPVLTTDYNLSKVAQIHDVPVLNINDLANAIKPFLLPGNVITIDIIREGKDPEQGVGYLDDGTMCVIEDGSPYIGQKVAVTVTSMLQTSAGRMVFGRVRKDKEESGE